MRFTLEIALGNETMQTDEHIGRALSLIGRAFVEGQDGIAIRDAGKIKDINGNTVGSWKHTESPIAREYDGQTHYMAKAAQSLVLMLTNLDYSMCNLEDAARITSRIHGLINLIETTEEVSTAEKMVREGLCLACGRPDSGPHLAGCPMRER